MQPGEKKFLYEVVAPSILYLTIDENDPILVGYKHRIKLEVCLICSKKQHERKDESINEKTATANTLSPSNQENANELNGPMLKRKDETPSVQLPLVDQRSGRGSIQTTEIPKQVEKKMVNRSKRGHKNLSPISDNKNKKTLENQNDKSVIVNAVGVCDVGMKTDTRNQATGVTRAVRKKLQEKSMAVNISDNIVSCNFCLKAFASKQELFDHNKIIKSPNHKCQICNACFSFEAYLLVHMKYHNSKQSDIYKCDICGVNAKNSTGMKRHMIKHTNEKCYKCCICGKESFDFGTSKTHMITHHTRNVKKGMQDSYTNSQGLGLMAVKKKGMEIDYTCIYCAKVFLSKQDFFNHARTLSSQAYSCEICGVKFSFRAFLLAHTKIHHEKEKGEINKVFTCDSCGLDAKTLTRLKRHMLTHTNEKCYKCCVCSKESPHYGTAKLHLMTHKKKMKLLSPVLKTEASVTVAQTPAAHELKGFLCDVCNQTFETKKDFTNHNKIFNPLTHKCEECGAAFPHRAYLLVHMKTHGKDRLNGTFYKCDECGLDAKNTTRLKRHMITHTKEQCYKCCLCPKTSSCFSTAQKHLKYHRRNGMFRCTCCNSDFLNRQALASHQLAVMDIKCELCGQEFPNRTSRTLHLKSEHSQQVFRCTMCMRVYTNQAEFDNHMTYHKNNKKKQCPVCGKFVSRMDKHLLSHTSLQEMDESELWMCHKCPMKFKLKSSFIRHLASHSEERNFHCHLCPKAFTSGSELGRHLRRHSNLTPHQCQECGKWFRERRNLKCHMLAHSESKIFQCPQCPQGFNYKSSLQSHMQSKHAHATEQQHSASEPQVIMPHPENISAAHSVTNQDQVKLSVMPLQPAAPLVQFTVISNWPDYNSLK